MLRPFVPLALAAALLLVSLPSADAQTRQEKVLRDREKVLADGFWIYNDLPRGLREARDKKLPLLVTLRCLMRGMRQAR